jgi:hypothetical protein
LPGPLGELGAGAGLAGLGAVAVGAGPDGARVVVVTPPARAVAVVALAELDWRAVVAVVLGAGVEPVLSGGAAVVVAVVSVAAAVELAVLVGGPAAANWPPRRKDGGPLWVSFQPATPAPRNATAPTPATTFIRTDGPRDTKGAFPSPPVNTSIWVRFWR